MKKLPIGIQTFSTIREDDYVYIDKTPLIHQMTQVSGRYFLSRPRRFGKSLLVDTLKELFEGNQILFKGLFIEDKWDWSKTYPVIKLDFASGVIESSQDLDQRIRFLLEDNLRRLQLDCNELLTQDPAGCFARLIQHAYERFNKKVVVLVDEYDKPILDNIDDPGIAAEVREGLKNLYSVLKGQDAYLQFVLMTGVSKFSKVSLFSGINQLEDITLDKDYSALCGYTQNDLETHFAEHLQGVDWDKLKDWYNGYSFMGEAVYNPFDILLFIAKDKTYRNYWFETGSPSFLMKLFQKERYFLPSLESIEVGEEILDSFEIENINPITLLFQAGYLTIQNYGYDNLEEISFQLKIPNREVKAALFNQLLATYSQQAEQVKTYRQSLFKALSTANFQAIEQQITSLFASIPWRNFTNNDLAESEGYYASVLYAWLSSINTTIIPEDLTNQGQADLTLKLGEQIYIIEIKNDHTKAYQRQEPNLALQQVIDKNYAQKYLAEKQNGKQVHQIGMVFNKQARNLVQMDWNTL